MCLYEISIWENQFRGLLRWVYIMRLLKSKLKSKQKKFKQKIALLNTDFSSKCLGSFLVSFYVILPRDSYRGIDFWRQIFAESSRTGGLTGNNHWKTWIFRFHYGSSDTSDESMDSYELQDLFFRELFWRF